MFKHHLIKRSLAGGLVIAVAGFASATEASASGARSVASPPLTPTQRQEIDQLAGNVSALFASEGGWHLGGSLAPRAPASVQGGFQWGDAGIGAAGATVLLLGAGAGVGMTRRRRMRRAVVG